MPGDPPFSRDDLAAFLARGQRAQAAVALELAIAELRALGITIARLPGEYEVNFKGGREDTVQRAETLDQALELGRAMATQRPPAATPARRRRRPLRMTAKAVNRRRRRAHWRRMVAQSKKNKEK